MLNIYSFSITTLEQTGPMPAAHRSNIHNTSSPVARYPNSLLGEKNCVASHKSDLESMPPEWLAWLAWLVPLETCAGEAPVKYEMKADLNEIS